MIFRTNRDRLKAGLTLTENLHGGDLIILTNNGYTIRVTSIDAHTVRIYAYGYHTYEYFYNFENWEDLINELVAFISEELGGAEIQECGL